MIGRIQGQLIAVTPPKILVDCHGVGYEIDAPMSTIYQLPSVGEKVTVLTHLAIREDAHQLFGFITEAERMTFRELIKVSGIGARTALSVLSGLNVSEIAQAISLQDSSRLVKVPGIGKKTAERLLLELKGKLGPDLGHVAHTPAGNQHEIIQALSALGYSDKEVQLAIKDLKDIQDVSDGIRQALKILAKN